MAPDVAGQGRTGGSRRSTRGRTAAAAASTKPGPSAQASDKESASADDDVAAGDEVAAAGGGQDRGGGPPMSTVPVPNDEDSEVLRREVHTLIGQVEALMSHMRDQIHTWCAQDLRAGYETSHERLGPAFGKMHALVADGKYDQNLREHGFAGEHLEFKRRGLRGALDAVVQAIRGERWGEMPDRVGIAAQAGLTVVGSVADALQLATPIKEAIALVPTAAELFKRKQPS